MDATLPRSPYGVTVNPMLRAVPRTCCLAASRSLALRSGILRLATSSMSFSLTEPATSLPGFEAAFSILAFSRNNTGVGGVFNLNSKERSSKMVIYTGITVPTWLSVAALYCFTNSMI